MITNYFLNGMADDVFHVTPDITNIPTSYYIGLLTASPTVSGTNVKEPTGGNYSRKLISAFIEDSTTEGAVRNKEQITFPESTASWGKITYIGIFDSITEGNLLMYEPLSSSRTVEAYTTFTFQAGSIKISLQNPTT